MNSKGERRTNKVSQLQVDKSKWIKKKHELTEREVEEEVEAGIRRLKEVTGNVKVKEAAAIRKERKQLVPNPVLVKGCKREEVSLDDEKPRGSN